MDSVRSIVLSSLGNIDKAMRRLALGRAVGALALCISAWIELANKFCLSFASDVFEIVPSPISHTHVFCV